MPPLEALTAPAEDDSTAVEELRRVDRALADCQRKLAHYRAALDAGSDPATVTEWINQATAEQAAAQAKRAQLHAARPMTVTKRQLRAVVTQAGDMVRALDHADPADPADRAQLYERLGIEGIYQPRERLVVVTADVVSEWCESHHRHELPLSRSAPSPVLPRLWRPSLATGAPALYLKEQITRLNSGAWDSMSLRSLLPPDLASAVTLLPGLQPCGVGQAGMRSRLAPFPFVPYGH